MPVQFTDNSAQLLAAVHAACDRGLEEIGQAAEKYAVVLTPVDTGNLRNSITHAVHGNTVYLGSNLFYAVYIEFGTGKYAENSDGTPSGKGRKGYWVFVKNGNKPSAKERKTYTYGQALAIYKYLTAPTDKGGLGLPESQVFITQGNKAEHMIRKAVADHAAEYRQIMIRALSEMQ